MSEMIFLFQAVQRAYIRRFNYRIYTRQQAESAGFMV